LIHLLSIENLIWQLSNQCLSRQANVFQYAIIKNTVIYVFIPEFLNGTVSVSYTQRRNRTVFY